MYIQDISFRYSFNPENFIIIAASLIIVIIKTNEKKKPTYHITFKNSNSEEINPNILLNWIRDVNKKERDKIRPKKMILR